MRLLVAGNLHLGRATRGVPEHLGLDASHLSAAVAWDALMDIARAERVDAVLIAGDLIDRANRRFEPFGAIERGLATLAQQGIAVVLVAGDDGGDALRELPEAWETVHLLGHGGVWESIALTDRDGESLIVAGWSAPGRTVTYHPLRDLPAWTSEATPAVLLAHATVSDGDHDAFAPITLDEIASGKGAMGTFPAGRLVIAGAPTAPRVDDAAGVTVLTPGGVTALSPQDTGVRGGWIVDVTADAVDLRHVALGAVRFETVAVDVAGSGHVDEIETRVIDVLHDTLDAAVRVDVAGRLSAVGVRLRLHGATAAFSDLPERLADLARTLDVQQRGVALAVVGADNDTTPECDLAPLLHRADPVGETARLLDALATHAPGEEPEPWAGLLRRTATRLHGVHRARAFAAGAADPEPDTARARDLLRREAWVTLDALVRQRGIDQEGAADR